MFTLGSEVPIDDKCRVFRMIRPDWITPIEGNGQRPSSQSFTDGNDDGKMSVFIEDEILAAGHKATDLRDLEEFPGYLTCWWECRFLRELAQTIVRDPVEFFPGHGLVSDSNGSRTLSVRRRLAKSAKWLELKSATCYASCLYPLLYNCLRWLYPSFDSALVPCANLNESG